MRCKNCGWENPDKNAKCEKCNVLFSGSQDEPESVAKPFAVGFDPRETAKGCKGCGYPARADDASCPNCGRSFGNRKPKPPVIKEDTPPVAQPPDPEPTPAPEPTPVPEPKPAPEPAPVVAPAPAVEQPAKELCNMCQESILDTINPWMPSEQVQTDVRECSLHFVMKEGEQANIIPLRFSGNLIQLNRGNTEPGNQTITSKVQAELTFENDKWYLQDKSALKTTFIYAGEKKELKSGDVIILGNRLFEFNVPANSPDEPL